jgi:hypothetical protein
MKTEFRKAITPKETRSLVIFDFLALLVDSHVQLRAEPQCQVEGRATFT